MTAQAIMSKYRRALRNGTGMTLSNDQLRELGEFGVLSLLSQIEAEELCPANTNTKTAISGSTSGATANPPTSGRSRPTPPSRAPLSIAALSEGL